MLADFEKKQKRHVASGKKIFLFVFAVFCILICGSLIYADVKIYQRKKELAIQLENLKNQIIQIKNNNSQLKDGISNTANNDYVERVAREQLDLQKSGEKVTVFLMPKDQKNQQQQASVKPSWLASLRDSIKNFFR